MAQLTAEEKDRRRTIMAELRTWLAKKGKNQRWLANELGIYHGYVSNLLTGKQLPSEEIVAKAQTIMEMTLKMEHPKKRVKRKTEPEPKLTPVKRKIVPRLKDCGCRIGRSGEIYATGEAVACLLRHVPGAVTPEELLELIAALRGRPGPTP